MRSMLMRVRSQEKCDSGVALTWNRLVAWCGSSSGMALIFQHVLAPFRRMPCRPTIAALRPFSASRRTVPHDRPQDFVSDLTGCGEREEWFGCHRIAVIGRPVDVVRSRKDSAAILLTTVRITAGREALGQERCLRLQIPMTS